MQTKLKDFITTSPGFQYSINIKYDLHNDQKVANYIPLKQTVELFKDVIKSSEVGETNRSRLIVGSYGTGKSHLSTVLLSILAKNHSLDKYDLLLEKIGNLSPDDKEIVLSELKSKKLLPVIVTGEGMDFDQALLLGLVSSLRDVGLDNIIPNTTFSVALEQILTWQKVYPNAYNNLIEFLEKQNTNIDKLCKELEHCDLDSYRLFEQGYKEVTHGANFQPLLRGKVEDVFRETVSLLPQDSYKGIIVLFDEFGKFLETHIENHRQLNLKPLQDFAEACNSSGEEILQLILITHKPIAQYASKYGHDMVNEWKKVEGRFKTVELVNQPSKVYEIISQVIIKEALAWKSYQEQHGDVFNRVFEKIRSTRLFSELEENDFEKTIIKGVYPLHPTTVFALPRFSQKVAQNERTIFTFLAGNEFFSLGQFLSSQESKEFSFLTLDVIFDYFENQMKSLNPQENIYQVWLQTTKAINRLGEDNLTEIKLLKALAIIKCLELENMLPPNQESLILSFYGSTISEDILGRALQNLCNKRILFEGATTGNFEIIEAGELDLEKETKNIMAKRKGLVELWNFLNKHFAISPILAKRYNDEFTMTRYFPCKYISVDTINSSLEDLALNHGQDGAVYFVWSTSHDETKRIKDSIVNCQSHPAGKRVIFVFATSRERSRLDELNILSKRYDALVSLLDQIEEGRHLQNDRVEILLWLQETEGEIKKILDETFRLAATDVYYNGVQRQVSSRSDLSRLVSDICEDLFYSSPKFNNEMINKHNLTTPIVKARQKIVNGLLKPFLKPKLEMTGTGPEMAIYRSIMLTKGLIVEDDEDRTASLGSINKINDEGLVHCLTSLSKLISETSSGLSFERIIAHLCNPPYGVRKGLIPILLGIVFHEQRNELCLVDHNGSEIRFTAEAVDSALKKPESYFVLKHSWSNEKEIFCRKILDIFKDYLDENDSLVGPSKQVIDGMKRWFLSLPRFTRDSQMLSKEAREVRRLLRQTGLASSHTLFENLPKIFNEDGLSEGNLSKLMQKVDNIKLEMDGLLMVALNDIEKGMIETIPATTTNESTLLGVLKNWYSSLATNAKDRLYSDGTQEFLDVVSTFMGENSVEFLKRILTTIAGVRPEDWNDSTVKRIVPTFADMVQEVLSLQDSLENITASQEIAVTLFDTEGQQTTRTFSRTPISGTGELLENLLGAYIDEYGDAITNNEKRQVLLNLLEKLIR